jgi:hypothetical protein
LLLVAAHDSSAGKLNLLLGTRAPRPPSERSSLMSLANLSHNLKQKSLSRFALSADETSALPAKRRLPLTVGLLPHLR